MVSQPDQLGFHSILSRETEFVNQRETMQNDKLLSPRSTTGRNRVGFTPIRSLLSVGLLPGRWVASILLALIDAALAAYQARQHRKGK